MNPDGNMGAVVQPIQSALLRWTEFTKKGFLDGQPLTQTIEMIELLGKAGSEPEEGFL